jgi:ssDNA-binding Zn-finger/Zn-ribbon topoisomerase 1
MFLGLYLEECNAWLQLTSIQCPLEGDPADWVVRSDSDVFTQITSRSVESSERPEKYFYLTAPVAKVRVQPTQLRLWRQDHKRFHCESRPLFFLRRYEWRWNLDECDPERGILTMTWQLFVNEHAATPAGPKVVITCTSNPDDLRRIQFFFHDCKISAAQHYLRLIEEMCYVDDIVAHRGRLSAEQEQLKRRSTDRIENETRKSTEQTRVGEERPNVEPSVSAMPFPERSPEAPLYPDPSFTKRAAAERQRLHANRRTGGPHDAHRLSKDLCLDCGAPVVIRRNNKFGHLFYGCSGWSPLIQERTCSGARPATCDLCHGELHERTNVPNSNVLRCENSPECPGTRQIPDDLDIHEWLRGNRTNAAEIRAHFTARGLMQRYRQPDFDTWTDC